ncbi:MAG TPA: hypothetical protein V6D20_01280, partial [Candidatus Obscuribacterales bacterium]
MTDTRAVMQQALAFVEFCWRDVAMNDYAEELRSAAESALRAALEQPEVSAEPVAWQWLDTAHFRKHLPKTAEAGAWRPLYAAP